MEKGTNIFEFNDYREYLRAYYSNRKKVNANYSHRLFAQQAGLSSPSHFLMIMKGTRNLSMKTIPKFAEGLKLGNKERRYFETLVLFNQTEDLQMKAKYFSELMTLKSALKGLSDLEKEKFDFLSKWYVVAIYVMADLKKFRGHDPAWVVRRLGGQVTLAQAKEALDDLIKLGLLVPDEKRGYRQASGAITVADDTRSVAVFSYHQSMIRLAGESLRRNHGAQREMNGATIAIPLEKLPEIKEKIRAFRKEINRLASSYENPDQVYQMNVQLFPLTVPEDQDT